MHTNLCANLTISLLIKRLFTLIEDETLESIKFRLLNILTDDLLLFDKEEA